jgi:hypothetical protein
VSALLSQFIEGDPESMENFKRWLEAWRQKFDYWATPAAK